MAVNITLHQTHSAALELERKIKAKLCSHDYHFLLKMVIYHYTNFQYQKINTTHQSINKNWLTYLQRYSVVCWQNSLRDLPIVSLSLAKCLRSLAVVAYSSAELVFKSAGSLQAPGHGILSLHPQAILCTPEIKQGLAFFRPLQLVEEGLEGPFISSVYYSPAAKFAAFLKIYN